MKKVFAFLFVSGLLVFAACQPKARVEETSADSSATNATTALDSAVMPVDTTSVVTDSAAIGTSR